jgi:hypothetical protein
MRVIDGSIPAIKTRKMVQNGHFTVPLYLTSGSRFATEEGLIESELKEIAQLEASRFLCLCKDHSGDQIKKRLGDHLARIESRIVFCLKNIKQRTTWKT